MVFKYRNRAVSGFLCVVLALCAAAAGKVAAEGSSGATWKGRLEIQDRAFVNSTGQPVLPLCAHFGEAFSAWTRRPAEVEQQLRHIKDGGYDCIRFWDNLGEYSEAWRGKEVTAFSWTNGDGVRVPTTPNYYEQLERFLRVLRDQQLRAHHSRGDLGRGRPAVSLDRVVQHSEAIALIYERVGWDVLALYEGNNEDFQNGNFGPEGLRQIVAPLKIRGALVASSMPPPDRDEEEAIVEYSRGFSVRYYHGRRDGTAVDRLRRKFTSGYDAPAGAPYLAWDGEPIGPNHDAGPGVSVNHTEDVEEIGLLHAMTLFAGRSAATYMSQHGVFWNGPIHEQAGFHVAPKLRRLLAEFAPDVMRWPLYHGAQAEAVLRSPDGHVDDSTGAGAPARLDQAVRDDRRRVVALVYGGSGPARVQSHLSCTADFRVITPLPNEDVRIDQVRVEPGSIHSLDYRVGRLVLGACIDR